jgi:NTP pyrophosphatase (non-canonical NTP hydrolase)
MTEEEIIKSAISTYGSGSQIDKTVEECGELIQALMKCKRHQTGKNINNVCDEIADVKIMIMQMEEIFPAGTIKERVEFKLNRLKDRINGVDKTQNQ